MLLIKFQMLRFCLHLILQLSTRVWHLRTSLQPNQKHDITALLQCDRGSVYHQDDAHELVKMALHFPKPDQCIRYELEMGLSE